MQGGVQRALIDDQHLVGDLMNALRDRPSVERLEGHALEDEEVERSLHEIGGSAHRFPSVIDTIRPHVSHVKRAPRVLAPLRPASSNLPLSTGAISNPRPPITRANTHWSFKILDNHSTGSRPVLGKQRLIVRLAGSLARGPSQE